MAIDHCQPHAGLFLFDLFEGSGGADEDAFHAQIARNLAGINDRSSGKKSGPDVKEMDGAIRADFYAPATADTFAGKNLLGHGPRWPQTIGGHRRDEEPFA